MHKKIITVLSAIFFLFCLWGIDIHEEINTSELIRLHVLANSNSEADQALKLMVKNEVVSYLQGELAATESLADSRVILQGHLEEIEQVAATALAEQGSADPVHLEYGHFDFPVKYYGGFSLPAGNYEALRIVIGEGQGNNWWCVLFPPMCFVDSNEVSLGQYSELTPEKEVVVKWKLLELLEEQQADQKADKAITTTDIAASADCQ